jgi:mono/diheme cytochrome c family protein
LRKKVKTRRRSSKGENCTPKTARLPWGEGQGTLGYGKDWPSSARVQVETVIRNGISGSPMPAWSQENGGPLTDEEINALVAYILTWQTGGPPTVFPTPTADSHPPLTPPPNVMGDPNQGATIYDQNCAVCHGENGEGRVGATLARDFPSIRPDLQLEATIARGVAGLRCQPGARRTAGLLTTEQIDHVALPTS